MTVALSLGITAIIMFVAGLLVGRRVTLNEIGRGAIGSKRSRGPLGID